MRVLLDECLPRPLRTRLAGHEVVTVPDAGWAGKTNGELLALAAADFEVFITVDKSLPSQQRLERLELGVILLSSPSNRLRDLEPLVPSLLEALGRIQPGELVRLGV